MSEDNTYIVNQVFMNEILIGKILDHVSIQTKPLVKLRLVSRHLNLAVLYKIRKEHSEIIIHNLGHCDKHLPCICTVFINSQDICNLKLHAYFQFLNKRVKINICKLQVQIEHFDKVVQFQLHRLILKELIGSNEDRIREFTGMFDLSYYGWDLKAERIARHCIRFGMQEGVDLHGSQLLNFDVFEVAEPHLHGIVNADKFEVRRIYTDEEDEEMVYFPINRFLKMPITCDTLTFILYGKDIVSLPRTITHQAVSNWNAKNVNLNFRFGAHNVMAEKFHECPENFKNPVNIQFVAPWNIEPVSANLLESVEIKLQYTDDILLTIEDQLDYDYYSPYDNIIANVQRAFPSRNMIVKLSETNVLIAPENMHKVFAKFIRLTEQNQQRNGSVTFKLYYEEDDRIPIKVPHIFNSSARLVGEQPEHCWYLDEILNIPKETIKSPFGCVTVWYGKMFRL
ncbi:F-box domain-containing protein [Caenorhabditis elegans]|uniref:F-box domain-containing protein n=1 Tax=Caenorhabditis elegans TaxID=6239 RepID=D1MN84_CAEEL|nr:F-box domain-containing protein [Caenorhabditis elegans]CBI63219.1 F-box domain-containing protein [Caenorhabditis elegans]|eukprot:NP_001255195.1 Uncharacterized protein CELE_F53A2.11 [Caenorhabditis elegans]